MERLEEAQDLMGEVSIEDITKNLLTAAKAVEFESKVGRNRLVKKTREHLEAEKNLRRKEGEELKNCQNVSTSRPPARVSHLVVIRSPFTAQKH